MPISVRRFCQAYFKITARAQCGNAVNLQLTDRVKKIRPSPTVSITARAGELRATGRDIIALSAGEPDFATPPHICEAAHEGIRRGQTKYTAVDGKRSLKEAIILKFQRDNELTFKLDQILVSSGGKQACYNACQVLVESGDEVIIPAPHWVSFPDMVRLADAEPVIVHTNATTGFRMTAEQLDSAITERTRALIINSPCNPTGSAYTRTDWKMLGDVLSEHPRIFIITDDIYEHIYWGVEPFCSFLTACPQLASRTLVVNGVSKCYAMTGWRIGYVAGPEAIIKAMTTIQSQSTTNACTISQVAAEAALNGDQTTVTKMCAAFKARHDYIIDGLNRLTGFDCRPCEGTFYAFPNIDKTIESIGAKDDIDFCSKLLEEKDLALVPGSAFGAPGHLRLSFAANQEILEVALNRISEFIN